MTALDGQASTIPCAGWEDEGSPEPTCWKGGCSRLDDDGSCPGNGLRSWWCRCGYGVIGPICTHCGYGHPAAVPAPENADTCRRYPDRPPFDGVPWSALSEAERALVSEWHATPENADQEVDL
jgi:hypothetical protein